MYTLISYPTFYVALIYHCVILFHFMLGLIRHDVLVLRGFTFIPSRIFHLLTSLWCNFLVKPQTTISQIKELLLYVITGLQKGMGGLFPNGRWNVWHMILNHLRAKFVRGNTNKYLHSVIPPYWHYTGILNFSWSKTRTHLFYTIYIMVADDVVMQCLYVFYITFFNSGIPEFRNAIIWS